jgi:hypothetical protein
VARRLLPQSAGDRLEVALRTLRQAEAAFVNRRARTNRAHAELEHQMAERFARIEAQMAEIMRILAEHGRILADHSRLLERLPEAIRDKIGFKGQ